MSDFQKSKWSVQDVLPARSTEIELRLLHECGRLVDLVQCNHTDDLLQAAEIYRGLALVVDHAFLRVYLFSKYEPAVVATVYESIARVDPKGSILGETFCGDWDPVDDYLAEAYGFRPWRSLN
ncbi:MAG: hypothetical protein WBB68_04890 [Candidatus Moraniibacteriota bacterium]